MNRHYLPANILIFLVIFLVLSGSTVAQDWRYPGQDSPGLTLEVFAPGVISVSGTTERSLSLSPNGDELFYTQSTGWPDSKIMHMKRQGDEWSAPQVADFLRDDNATQAILSPDGSVYFLVWDYDNQIGDIYVARLIDGQYADPVIINSILNNNDSN